MLADKVKTVEYFTFDKLNDKAKEKARQWYRDCSNGDNYFSECIIEDSADIADILGIDLRQTRKTRMNGEHHYAPTIYWSGFWSQGDGACFECRYQYKKGALKAIKKNYPNDKVLHNIALTLQDAQKRVFYSASASTTTGRNNNMSVSVDIDRDVSQQTFDYVETAISEALNYFADWIYRQLESAYDYENSDSVVDDNILNNGYLFDCDGNIE